MSAFFREWKGTHISYNRQGYIYFMSRLYKELPQEKKQGIELLCETSGGEYAKALLEFMTTDHTATAVCLKHYCSKSTLYRAVRKYYENFPRNF